MDKYREKMEAMMKMSPEEMKKAMENLKSLCICPTCPTHNACAKKAGEMVFCVTGKSFMCISYEKGCECPKCPVTAELGLHYTNFCTRGEEKAQRFEHTVWGSSLVKK